MNIFFLLSQQIEKNAGGVQRVTYVLSKYFLETGHKVFFIFTHERCKKIPDGLNGLVALSLADETTRSSIHSIELLNQYVQKYNPDVIIDQEGRSHTILQGLKRNTKVKLITAIHTRIVPPIELFLSATINSDNPPGMMKRILAPVYACYYYRKQLNILRQQYKISDNLVVVAKSLLPVFEKHIGKQVEQGKCVYINNPLSYSDYFPEEQLHTKSRVVLSVARLEYSTKRLDHLLDIWRVIEPMHPDWKLVIVGGPRDETDRAQIKELKRLQNISKKYKLKNVSFEGAQEPLPYYRKSAIFAMTSHHESWGMTLTEAMSQGCVPVAFNSFEAAEEIINKGETGILVKPFSTKLYARELDCLMSDKQYRIEIAKHALASVKHLQVENIASQWLNLMSRY